MNIRKWLSFRRGQQKAPNAMPVPVKPKEIVPEAKTERMPAIEGEYKKRFLGLPIKSPSFVEACKKANQDPRKKFAEFFREFQESLDPLWNSARATFIQKRKQIAQEYPDENARIAMERHALERIFTAVIAEQAKIVQQKK